MCGRAFSEYNHYRHTSARPKRSLVEWLRDLSRPRQPQVPEAEVVPFPAAVTRVTKEPDRSDARAA